MSTSTYNEQDELLKYEYTLASCYEAEYLLSLKLQENMMHAERNEYYDGFEVQEYYPPTSVTADSSDRSQLCSRAEAVTGAPSSVPATSEECMETEYGPTQDNLQCTRPDLTVVDTANDWLPIKQCSPPPPLVTHHGQQPTSSSMGIPVQQNGYVQDSQNLHNDGPSRKRICLRH